MTAFELLDRKQLLLGRVAAMEAAARGIDKQSWTLLAACRRFCEQEVEKGALFAAAGPQGSESAVRLIEARQQADLNLICGSRAASPAMHEGRALAFCCWDDAELETRASSSSYVDDRLMWALVADLAGMR